MSETVSSAIKLVAGILIVALLVAFGFSTMQSQKANGNKALNNIEKMNTTLDEADLTQYDGATMTGSQVAEAVKALKDKEGVTVFVYNGAQTVVYGNNPASGTSKALQIQSTTDDFGSEDAPLKIDTAVIKVISQKKYKNYYITPSQSYTGTVHRSAATNAIIAVAFDADKALTSSANSSTSTANAETAAKAYADKH